MPTVSRSRAPFPLPSPPFLTPFRLGDTVVPFDFHVSESVVSSLISHTARWRRDGFDKVNIEHEDTNVAFSRTVIRACSCQPFVTCACAFLFDNKSLLCETIKKYIIYIFCNLGVSYPRFRRGSSGRVQPSFGTSAACSDTEPNRELWEYSSLNVLDLHLGSGP